ncbi:MAG: LPXTG cell wall anchor domain-containing protein [Clostridia bacterium]|nr:LPXTG cell wall anchor domain-containing protein [Clostridia bacterium]
MKKLLVLVFALMMCMAACAYAAETTYSGACAPIVINTAGEHTIILNNATIGGAGAAGISVEAPATKLTIVLKSGTMNEVRGDDGFAAIANNGLPVVIRCEETGASHEWSFNCGHLSVVNNGLGAAIGSGEGEDFTGSIVIESGDIVADSVWGAAIGSGQDGDFAGTVIIKGGLIVADGAAYGAGIGSGNNGDFIGTVTIAGGEVIADGGNGAGIGAGQNGDFNGKVTLRGDIEVQASGVRGIGAGYNAPMGANSEIYVEPVFDNINVEQGNSAYSMTALQGAPYAVKTNLTALLNGSSRVRVQTVSAPEVPQTGDSMNFVLLAAMAIAGMIGMTVILRRKNEA